MINQIPFHTSKSETYSAGWIPATPSPFFATLVFCPLLVFTHLQIPLPRLPVHIDFYFHHFHALTNPSMRKPFVFRSMQDPRGVTQRIRQHRSGALSVSPANPFLSYGCGLLRPLGSLFRLRVLYFQSLAASCAQNGGWGGGRQRISERGDPTQGA